MFYPGVSDPWGYLENPPDRGVARNYFGVRTKYRHVFIGVHLNVHIIVNIRRCEPPSPHRTFLFLT